MKTVMIGIGVVIMLLLALMGYACIIVGSDAERQMGKWERGEK